MKTKKRNGFTLIELLLVIALVISLLGIAVVNVMKLTDKQKKNSYESVKEEVITAAEQYFSSNEYLFEGINPGGFGIIPVGKLVEEDYLNKLTNPVTGLALNKCDKVIATRDVNGKFDFKFETDTHTSDCQFNALEIHSDATAPTVNQKFVKSSDYNTHIYSSNNDWFNFNDLGSDDLYVKFITDGILIGRCEGTCTLESGVFNSHENVIETGYLLDKTSYNREMTKKTYSYKICKNNTEDKSCTVVSVTAGVDRIKPTCLASINPNKPENYVHKEEPKLIFSSTDVTSGFEKDGQVVFSLTTSPTIKSGTNVYPGTFADIAGNRNDCNKTVVYDAEDPQCPTGPLLTYENVTSGKQEFCDPSKGTDNWHCTDVVATLNKGENWARYEWDGVETKKTTKTYSTSGTHKPTITAYDENGDRITCTATEFKIDKTQPSLSLTLPGTSDNSKWYSVSSINYKAVASDNGSGINTMKSFWNKTGLTTALATNSTNKWNGSKYPTGGTYTVPVTKGAASKTHEDKLSAEGHRKIAYVVCDKAGNCNSAEKDAKMDRTSPTLNLTLSGYKTATGWNSVSSVNYKAVASDSLSGIGTMTSYWNKTGLTTSKADSTTYSWNTSSSSYYGGSSKVISITKGASSKTDENKLSAEGHRKIRYTICDQADNCVSSAKYVKIDRTPPVVVRSGSGPILCKRPSEPGNNAHGYSVEGKDNLSGTTIKLYQYYSSWDCGSTNNFHWADSSDSTSVAEDGKKIFTALAGCSNNPSPAARFSLVDGAGNKYTSSGKDYLEVKHAKGSYNTSNIKNCSSSVWWNESPNR